MRRSPEGSLCVNGKAELAMGSKLYVGNLNYRTTEETLKSAFSAGGRNVVRVTIPTDRETGRPRGFAFVEMENAEQAQAAISALDGQDLDGRNVRVNEAREREGGAGGGGEQLPGWNR